MLTNTVATVSKRKHIEWVDIYRGIGILLVIVGHVGFGAWIDKIIHAFHMPLFFFSAGYLFRTRDVTLRSFVLRRFKRLLIPYLFGGLLYWFIWIITNLEARSIMPLWSLIIGGSFPIGGGLQWFLLALFLCDVLYFILEKYIKNNTALTIVAICIALSGNMVTVILDGYGIWHFDAALVAIAFYHVGHLVKENKGKSSSNLFYKSPAYLVVVYGIGVIIIATLNSSVNMRSGNYGNWILFYLAALLGIIVTMNLSCFLSNGQWKPIIMLKKYLSRIGRNSLIYLIFNMVSIFISTWLLDFVFLMPMGIYKLFYKVLSLFMTLLIIELFNFFIKKLHIGSLFGQVQN